MHGGQGASGSPRAVRREPPPDFLIEHHQDSCVECWGCVRVCPARALRVVDGRSEVIAERCVKCGRCVSACGNAGHTVRDDSGRVRELLRTGRPVVALLASECSAALYPVELSEVESMLVALGFAAVETSVPGEEMVAEAYERWHAGADDALPKLRSTCPVTVEWVRRFHPQLTGALVPIVPPYIAQARLIREIYDGDVGIVYVSPCYVRKDEVYDASVADAVDVAIDFLELKGLIAAVQPRPGLDEPRPRRPYASKELSLTDGFPRAMMEEGDPISHGVTVVRGLEALESLLCAIERGETAPPVVDMLLCDGCIDGPAVSPALSVFAKRGIVTDERDRHGPSLVSSRELLSALPSVEMRRSFHASPVLRHVPSAAEIDASLEEAGFLSREDAIDCGACGYPTCVEHAEAVILGTSSWEMCFPLQRRRVRLLADELDRLAARDALTSLYNRRTFDERLLQEAARAERHHSPLSLVMADLDGFKAINDKYGHPGGDEVLVAFSGLLDRLLRTSDIACRYGGDEFAIILPDTGKTEAFAVAEKVREALSDLVVELPGGDEVRLTASFGVAALGSAAPSAPTLLSQADRALYSAKDAGRDRTHLAAG